MLLTVQKSFVIPEVPEVIATCAAILVALCSPQCWGHGGQGDIVDMQSFIRLLAMFDQLGAIGLVAVMCFARHHCPSPLATHETSHRRRECEFVPTPELAPLSRAGPSRQEQF